MKPASNKKPKKDMEQLLCEALQFWDKKKQQEFFLDILPMIEIFDIDQSADWVEKEVGADNMNNVRIVKLLYVVSRVAERHSGLLISFKLQFPGLYKKMEDIADQVRALHPEETTQQ